MDNLIIKDFLEGNKRFLAGKSRFSSENSLKKLKEFAKVGQSPKAVILCCSDSRTPVEMILDQDIGDLFVIRVAGNIVAPSLVGSVEFAVSTFATSLVLVMGHSQCGAITATLKHIDSQHMHASENIQDIISRIKPHVFPIAQVAGLSFEEKLTRSVEANILASVEKLKSSSQLIEGLVYHKKLAILGAVLDLETGSVKLLDI